MLPLSVLKHGRSHRRNRIRKAQRHTQKNQSLTSPPTKRALRKNTSRSVSNSHINPNNSSSRRACTHTKSKLERPTDDTNNVLRLNERHSRRPTDIMHRQIPSSSIKRSHNNRRSAPVLHRHVLPTRISPHIHSTNRQHHTHDLRGPSHKKHNASKRSVNRHTPADSNTCRFSTHPLRGWDSSIQEMG